MNSREVRDLEFLACELFTDAILHEEEMDKEKYFRKLALARGLNVVLENQSLVGMYNQFFDLFVRKKLITKRYSRELQHYGIEKAFFLLNLLRFGREFLENQIQTDYQ